MRKHGHSYCSLEDVFIELLIAAKQFSSSNFTYSHFYYHMIAVNVANFDKLCSTVSQIKVTFSNISN